MNKKKIEEIKWKSEEMKTFVKELLDNGFRVFTSENRQAWEKTSYVHFEKNGNIGYCQLNVFGGFDFSTCHKPCRECGTGYRLNSEGVNPTIEWAESTFIDAPHWARSNARKAIRKYNGVDDYVENERVLTQIELIGGD